MSKLISICFPIYNRIEIFKYTFPKTMDEVCLLNSDEIEVVVSVNPDEKTIDETKAFLIDMQKKHAFVLNINESNLGIGGNGRKVFELASGKYIWMIGDDDYILPGCLDRLIKALHENPDIGWVHLAYGKLTGNPGNEQSRIEFLTSYLFTDNGYYHDGKKGVIYSHNRFGGKLLFSSANLFLRNAWKEVADDNGIENPQLGAMFCAAAKGAAFFDKEICVIGGGETTWSAQRENSELIIYYRDLYSAIGHGYSEKEINHVIKYHLRHNGLYIWFRMYRLILLRNKIGKQAFAFFFHIMPIQTIITTLSLPAIAVYLLIRHKTRKKMHEKNCEGYENRYRYDSSYLSQIKQ